MENSTKSEATLISAELSPEIWALIFCNLPAVYLHHTLRRVCRSWDSLIRSSFFAQQHLHSPGNKRNPGIISLHTKKHSPGYPYFISLTFAEWDRRFAGVRHEFGLNELPLQSALGYSMSNACHGLVCLYAPDAVHVMNPSIRTLTTLPNASPHVLDGHPGVAVGFDSKRNTYKVVRLFRCLNEDYGNETGKSLDEVDDIGSHYVEGTEGMRCEVYTLGGTRKSWKSIGKAPVPADFESSYFGNPVIVNGAIHWSYCYMMYSKGPKVAISFSLSDETFDVIRHPTGRLRRMSELAELGGYLCVCDTKESEPPRMDIWVLKDYEGREWVKRYIVDLSRIYCLDRRIVLDLRPAMIVDGKMVFCGWRGRIDYYDIEREIFYCDRHPIFSDHRDVVPYVGSLIWPGA